MIIQTIGLVTFVQNMYLFLKRTVAVEFFFFWYVHSISARLVSCQPPTLIATTTLTLDCTDTSGEMQQIIVPNVLTGCVTVQADVWKSINVKCLLLVTRWRVYMWICRYEHRGWLEVAIYLGEGHSYATPTSGGPHCHCPSMLDHGGWTSAYWSSLKNSSRVERDQNVWPSLSTFVSPGTDDDD